MFSTLHNLVMLNNENKGNYEDLPTTYSTQTYEVMFDLIILSNITFFCHVIVLDCKNWVAGIMYFVIKSV